MNDKDNIVSLDELRYKKFLENQKEATNGLDTAFLGTFSRSSKGNPQGTRTSSRSDRNRRPRNTKNNNPQPIRKPNPNKKRNYSSSRKRNAQRLIAAGMLSAEVLLGGVVGSSINNARIASTEYSLDEYDKTELFKNTNNLIQYVAEDTYFEKNPNDKSLINDYSLESYNEANICGSDVTLKLNYTKVSYEFDSGVDSKSINVKLPKDFAKDVYLHYKDLRDSSNVSNEKKEKTAYWLKMNKCVTNLKDGLNDYIENSTNKDYSDSAKDVLKNSKIDNNLSKEEDDGRDF